MADYVKAANLADLAPGTRMEVEVDGKSLALCNIGARFTPSTTRASMPEARWAREN